MHMILSLIFLVKGWPSHIYLRHGRLNLGKGRNADKDDGKGDEECGCERKDKSWSEKLVTGQDASCCRRIGWCSGQKASSSQSVVSSAPSP